MVQTGGCQPLKCLSLLCAPAEGITDVKALSHPIAVMCKVLTLPRLNSPALAGVCHGTVAGVSWADPRKYSMRIILGIRCTIPSSYSSAAERKNLFGANSQISLQSRTLDLAAGHHRCELTEFLQV